MIISKPQRSSHEKRTRSSLYVSHVLPASKRHNPGIPSDSDSMMVDVNFTNGESIINFNNNYETAIADEVTTAMPEVIPTTMVLMQASSSQMVEQRLQVPQPQAASSIYSQSQSSPDDVPPESASSSTTAFIPYCHQWKKKCRVCVAAGWSGVDCPGSGNWSKCKFRVSNCN